MKKIDKILLTMTVFLICLVGIMHRNYYVESLKETINISEICINNEKAVYNKTGDFLPYVELYNASDKTINISGYAMSDSKYNLKKYVLGDIEIEPNEYIVIWLDKKVTDFQIKESDTLYLTNSTGRIIDVITVGKTDIDKSYSKINANNQWVNNTIPTPGEVNNEKKDENVQIGFVDSPIFSVEPGFYSESFVLKLFAAEGTKIYYTIDGTIPSKDSLLYIDGILIEDVSQNENQYASIKDISVKNVYIPTYEVEKCNVIRAVAIDEEGNQSEISTGSYFVGYKERYGFQDVYVVSLVTDPDNLFSDDKGIYTIGNIGVANWGKWGANEETAVTNYTREGKGWHRETSIELFSDKQEFLCSQNIEIGIHGGWSTIWNQKSFNLYRDEKAFFNDNEQEILDKTTDSLMLRAGGYRDLYSTKFRDVLNQDLVKERNVTILQSIPCQVFINGEYWGLYNLQERIDGSLVERNFGVKRDEVIILKNQKVVGGSDDEYQSYQSIVEFAKTHNMENERNYKMITSMIDVQSYIDYYCFQIYVANADSVANNYALWKSSVVKEEDYYDGKWRWILYDTDDSLGMVEGLTEYDTDSFSWGHWTTAPMADDLFSSLIKNDTFKRQFVETFIQMADSDFWYENVRLKIDEYYDMYCEAMVVSQHRFYNENFSEEDYYQEVAVIKEFFEKRRDEIIKHMEVNLELGDIEVYLDGE